MKNENLSSEGQRNLDRLVSLLKDRLQSRGKAKSTDTNGNVIYIDCDVYATSMLETFIHLSISDFNQVPYFSFYTLENSRFIDCFSEVLVEGATLYALSSQALIERGREFQISDSGLNFLPPSVSEMLNTQYCTLLQHHWEKLKHIKLNIKDFDKK